MKLTTTLLCSTLGLLSASVAEATTGSWRLDFHEEVLDPFGAQIFAIPGETVETELFVLQNEYCVDVLPGEQNPACPATAALSLAPPAANVSACFVINGQCVAETTVPVGSSAEVRVTLTPATAYQTFTLQANAMGSTGTQRSTSIPIHVVQPLFDPPSPIKLFRGAPSSSIALALNRPTGLTDPISLSLFVEAGSTTAGLTSSLAPSTLSASATSATLSIAAANNAAVGTRDLAVAATPGVQLHRLIAPFELEIANAFTVSVASFSMRAGQTASRAITVSRDPAFTDPITLAVSGLSGGAGVQAMVSQGQLIVEAAPTAKAGTYLVGVRGTSGTIQHEIAVAVTVIRLSL